MPFFTPDEIMPKTSGSSYGGSSLEGQKKMEEVYADQIKEGYSFRLNAHSSIIKNLSRNLKGEGLEVFIGDRAFWDNGYEDSNFRAIFVRKK